MLTEKDKAWLEKRAVESCDTCKTPRRYCALCCRHQKYGAALRDMFSLSGLTLFVFMEGYREAAEFEARVAAKLVSNNFPCRGCPDFLIATKCPITTRGTDTDYGPFPCLLRQARLAVEAEMEKEK